MLSQDAEFSWVSRTTQIKNLRIAVLKKFIQLKFSEKF